MQRSGERLLAPKLEIFHPVIASLNTLSFTERLVADSTKHQSVPEEDTATFSTLKLVPRRSVVVSDWSTSGRDDISRVGGEDDTDPVLRADVEDIRIRWEVHEGG